MVDYHIRMADADWAAVQASVSRRPREETAAFVLAGMHSTSKRTVLLARRVVEISDSEYRVRTRQHIELSPRAVNGLAALCEANSLGAIMVHSHPGDGSYSLSDDEGEARIARFLQPLSPRMQIMGSLLVTPRATYARVWSAGHWHPVSALTVVGRQLERVPLDAKAANDPMEHSDVYDRQIRALGADGQCLIQSARVAVVGTGGTGSAVAEQLVRLGVRDLLLIDRDVLEPSNITRVYGSRYTDVVARSGGRTARGPAYKAEVVGRWLRKINPSLRLTTVASDVTYKAVARRLLDRDVIFACTDDHWGRSVLNQLAYQYLIPVINVGVAVAPSDAGDLEGNGVVQLLRPGLGCLCCGNYLDADRIKEEALPEHELRKLAAEGYVRGLQGPAPSVVTLTTTVAGLATTLFVQIMTDFMGEKGALSRQNYDIPEGIVRRGTIPPRRNCICSRNKGKGDLGEPLAVR